MIKNILFKQSDQQMHIYVRGQEARSKYLHYNVVVNFCGDDNIGDVTSLLLNVIHPSFQNNVTNPKYLMLEVSGRDQAPHTCHDLSKHENLTLTAASLSAI